MYRGGHYNKCILSTLMRSSSPLLLSIVHGTMSIIIISSSISISISMNVIISRPHVKKYRTLSTLFPTPHLVFSPTKPQTISI